jgi:hypothetical protein
MAHRGSVVGWVLALAVWAAVGGEARGQNWLNERGRATVGARAIDLRYRLLISAEFTAQGGRVLSVNPAGPAAWMRHPSGKCGAMEPGDVVTAIDGMPVRSAADDFSARNAGGKVKRVTVRD